MPRIEPGMTSHMHRGCLCHDELTYMIPQCVDSSVETSSTQGAAW
jgi:hypothetical protein